MRLRKGGKRRPIDCTLVRVVYDSVWSESPDEPDAESAVLKLRREDNGQIIEVHLTEWDLERAVAAILRRADVADSASVPPLGGGR